MISSPPIDLIDPEMMARLANLPLFARQPKIGQVSGHHASPHRGSSLEFAEYRRYEPGDDLRRLDWRIFGRSDRYFVKEFEADTNLRCCLTLDASGSMAYGGKFDYARRLAAALAFLAVQQGDAAGCCLGATELEVALPCSRKPAHFQALLETLAAHEPKKTGGFVEVLHEVAERVPRRALILVFSDGFAEPSELDDALRHLRHRRHEVAFFQVLARDEASFPFDQPLRFADLEGSERLPTEPNAIRREYLAAVETHLAALRDLTARNQVDYRLTFTDEDLESVLAEFLSLRATSRR